METSVAPARAKTSRRTLLAGAAWSVPVIAAAAAAPQVAASGETIPKQELIVSAYGIYNRNDGGSVGPLVWEGGHIAAWNYPHSGIVSYVVTLTFTGGGSTSTTTVMFGSATIPPRSWFTFPQKVLVEKPVPAGTYVVTMTVTASDGAAPPAYSAPLTV